MVSQIKTLTIKRNSSSRISESQQGKTKDELPVAIGQVEQHAQIYIASFAYPIDS